MLRQEKNLKFNALHRITALVEKRRIPENSRCIFGAISHKTSYNGGNFRKKILLVKKNKVRSDFFRWVTYDFSEISCHNVTFKASCHCKASFFNFRFFTSNFLRRKIFYGEKPDNFWQMSGRNRFCSVTQTGKLYYDLKFQKVRLCHFRAI